MKYSPLFPPENIKNVNSPKLGDRSLIFDVSRALDVFFKVCELIMLLVQALNRVNFNMKCTRKLLKILSNSKDMSSYTFTITP